jgi:hypothetical protein
MYAVMASEKKCCASPVIFFDSSLQFFLVASELVHSVQPVKTNENKSSVVS